MRRAGGRSVTSKPCRRRRRRRWRCWSPSVEEKVVGRESSGPRELKSAAACTPEGVDPQTVCGQSIQESCSCSVQLILESCSRYVQPIQEPYSSNFQSISESCSVNFEVMIGKFNNHVQSMQDSYLINVRVIFGQFKSHIWLTSEKYSGNSLVLSTALPSRRCPVELTMSSMVCSRRSAPNKAAHLEAAAPLGSQHTA